MNEIKKGIMMVGECGFVAIGWFIALLGFGEKHWASGNPADVMQQYMEDNYLKEEINYNRLKEIRDYCNEPVSGTTFFRLKASDDTFSLEPK